MKTQTTFKHWMHYFHDSSVKAAHHASHLLHEGSFWAILAFAVLTAGLIALVVLFGDSSALPEYYRMPIAPIPIY